MVSTAPRAEQHLDHNDDHPLVVGVDPERSASAVVWAAEEAERTGTRLVVVMVRDDHVQDSPGLAGLAGRLTSSEVTIRRVAGHRVEALLSEAAGASALVVGHRTRTGAKRAVIGSTSLALAGRCPVPLVVVPEPWIQPSLSSAPVVVGVEVVGASTGGPDDEVLDFAFVQASRWKVPLLVVSAWDVPPLSAWSPSELALCHSEQDEQLALRLLPWRERHPDVDVASRSVAEPLGQALLDIEHVAQLTVVGRHRSPHASGFAPGSSTRRLVHRATRPVVVVPVRHDVDARGDPPSRPTWAPMF